MPSCDPKAVIAAMPAPQCLWAVPTLYVRMLAEAGLNEQAVKEHLRLFIAGLCTAAHRNLQGMAAAHRHTILEAPWRE